MLIKLLLLLSAAFCVVYGLCRYLGRRVALFSVLVVAAFGCFMMGHLYEFLSQLTSLPDADSFHVGMLARIGGYAFLFSASYAQMDGLVDDRTSGMGKYRCIALIAPAAMIVLAVPMLRSSLGVFVKIVYAFVFLFAGLTAYYNLKHLIIPDVSCGIIDSIRAYSLLSLASALFYGLMLAAEIMHKGTLSSLFAVLLAVTYPCTVIAMEKGRQKWTT